MNSRILVVANLALALGLLWLVTVKTQKGKQ